jgi:hypothetical protein
MGFRTGPDTSAITGTWQQELSPMPWSDLPVATRLPVTDDGQPADESRPNHHLWLQHHVQW